MDNHAGSHTNFEWLAGFCDADGYINIRRNNIRRRKTIQYTPEILFSNRNPLIIGQILFLLDSLGVNKYVYTQGNGVTHICVKRFTKILVLLNEIEAYLITKRKLGFLVRGYCNSRLDSITAGNNMYTNFQLSLYKTLKNFLMELSSKALLARGLESLPLVTVPSFNYTVTGPWLAGFIDGGGSLSVVKQNRPSGAVDLYPSINITSCSVETIDLICSFLLKNDIAYSLYRRTRGASLPWYELNVQAIDSIKKTIHLVKPFLIGKKEQASLLYKFCDSKKMNDKERCFALRDRIIELNSLCGASETNA